MIGAVSANVAIRLSGVKRRRYRRGRDFLAGLDEAVSNWSNDYFNSLSDKVRIVSLWIVQANPQEGALHPLFYAK